MKADRKAALRARVYVRMRGLDPDWVREASGRVMARLARLPEFGRAAVVGCYLARPREVQTEDLLRACRAAGKTVCVPASRPATADYGWARLDPGAALVAGPWGVLEPERPIWCAGSELDFVVAPGVAFDRQGRRLGRGGGHFDRLLADVAAFKAGVAFEAQLVAKAPAAAHDVRMDVVVTESNVYPRRSGPRGGGEQ